MPFKVPIYLDFFNQFDQLVNMHLISQFYNSQFRIYKRISFLIMIIRGCSTTFHLCVYQVNIPIQFQFFFTSAVLSFEVKFLVEGFHFLLMKGLLLFFKNKNIFGCFCSYHQVSINYHFSSIHFNSPDEITSSDVNLSGSIDYMYIKYTHIY